MNIDQIRALCLSFPGATEQIQWGDDLLFKVGGKMFAVAALEPAKVCLSFKVTPENFAELTERPGIIPAPYLARAKWVALESPEVLAPSEFPKLLKESYELILAKLPRKIQMAIRSGDKDQGRVARNPRSRPAKPKRRKRPL
jgi:predicted DNA-binding protein (MmcQ/YjbR family)